MSDTLTALTQTENRALAYAIQSGQAIGGLRNIRSLLESAAQFPEMRDYYMTRAAEYTNRLLAEIDPERGWIENEQTADPAQAD